MRLKEESGNWRAHGLKRRDFRHTHDAPEVDTSKVKPKKPRPSKNKHRHVWVEVSFEEYERYANKGRFPYWLYPDRKEPEYWKGWTKYFVCADCLDTKRKEDKGRRRSHYRRKYGRAW